MTDLQHLPDPLVNGGGGALIVAAPVENIGAKRQRRPSVRLGDIGDQSYDSLTTRRPNKQWKVPVRDSGKGSRSRPMTNLAGDYHTETLDADEREDGSLIGSCRVRDSKQKQCPTKRVRYSQMISKSAGGEVDEKYSGGEDVDDDDEQSPIQSLKEYSPIHSLDNMGDDDNREQEREVNLYGDNRMGTRARVSRDFEGPSDTDTRNWNSGERNGVRVWLNQLGLGRYAPVFEIHEVDDEVLPLLTLEDLKDMGINAVGSRRKMYCAIQKLSKGFS